MEGSDCGHVVRDAQTSEQCFVVEQDCVFLDLDNEDQVAIHIIGTYRNRIVCCARVFGPDESSGMSRIGRVVTISDMRSKGVGKALMRHAIDECMAKWPSAKIKNWCSSSPRQLLRRGHNG